MTRRTAELAPGSIDFLDVGDQDAPVVMVLDGLGSRLVGELAARVASDAGVRVVAPDRPGYWSSAPRDGDVTASWPRAAAELLDHLDIARVGILASSAACPHAFAMAAALGSRVTAVAIVGPMAPLQDAPDLSDMHPAQLRTFRMARRRPALGVGAMRIMGRLAGRWPRLVLRMVASQRPAVDAERIADPQLGDLMLQSIPGLIGPPVADDLAALVGDWTHVVGATEQPVRIWVGTLDSVHPQSMARALQRRATNASTTTVEGGFFACTDRLDEALRWTTNPI